MLKRQVIEAISAIGLLPWTMKHISESTRRPFEWGLVKVRDQYLWGESINQLSFVKYPSDVWWWWWLAVGKPGPDALKYSPRMKVPWTNKKREIFLRSPPEPTWPESVWKGPALPEPAWPEYALGSCFRVLPYSPALIDIGKYWNDHLKVN